MKRKIFVLIAVVFIGIQFVPVEWNQSAIQSETDFISLEQVPQEIAVVLKSSCYDCHSNFTRYPWYDRIAPVSWWVNGHIDHGKGELNFSEWGSYSVKRKQKKLKEIVEEIEAGKMPLDSYLIMHGDAKLTPDQVDALKVWIDTINYKH